MLLKHWRNFSWAYYLSLGFIFILLMFSLLFYKERMLFVDPAWIVFNIINKGKLIIAENRYGAFITQIFPYFGSKLGLSLKSILILYSASFYLFYFFTAYIIGLKWKQEVFAILLALYLGVFVSDVFYWPNNEVHQGIAWMFLFLAYYQFKRGQKKPFYFYPLLLSFLFFAISSHLIVAIPILFLWIYLHIQNGIIHNLKNKKFLIITILLLISIFIRYKLSDSGWYDPVKLEGVKNISLQTILNSLQSGQANSFGKLILTHHWLAIPIFFFSICISLINRNYYNSLLLFLFTIAYFILICLTFPDAFDRTLRFYIESEWMALAIIISTPLAFWIINANKKSIILLFIFCINLAYILNSYSFFHTRYSLLAKTVDKIEANSISKAVVIKDKKESEKYFIMDWGLPVESMFYSIISNKKELVTLKIIHEELEIENAKDIFFSSFDIQSINQLNKDYFPLNKDNSYQIVENCFILERK
ncbi:MAG TPA: hypothetical protein VK027_10060 [Chitinophagaceae bacterium]|nr:hypothetical protein [Chitinophagaceae bacterium]